MGGDLYVENEVTMWSSTCLTDLHFMSFSRATE